MTLVSQIPTHPSIQATRGREQGGTRTQRKHNWNRSCMAASSRTSSKLEHGTGGRENEVETYLCRRQDLLSVCVCVCVCVKRRESTTAARSKLAGMREDGTPVGDPSGATARSSSVRDCRRLVAHRSSLIAHGRGPEQPDHDRRVPFPTSTLARIVRRET